jgi:hypothetical protein
VVSFTSSFAFIAVMMSALMRSAMVAMSFSIHQLTS